MNAATGPSSSDTMVVGGAHAVIKRRKLPKKTRAACAAPKKKRAACVVPKKKKKAATGPKKVCDWKLTTRETVYAGAPRKVWVNKLTGDYAVRRVKTAADGSKTYFYRKI
jgi:hypothetical protein